MIHVYKKWYIDADRHCYCLFKQVEVENKKTGEVVLQQRHKTYHSTVSACLQAFVRFHHRKITDTKELELKDAIKAFEKLENIVIKTNEGTVV